MYSQVSMFPTTTNYSGVVRRLEGIQAIWYQWFGNQPVTIEVGDFIRAKDCKVVCGFVVARIELHMGKKIRIPGYRVRLGNGRIDFISMEDAEFIG